MMTSLRTGILMTWALGAGACADLRMVSRADPVIDEHCAADNARVASLVPPPVTFPLTREDILAGLQSGNIPLSLGALMVTGTR
jgi:hypothetical protein